MRNRTGTLTQAAQTPVASAASPIVGHSRLRVAESSLVSGAILDRTGGTVWVTQTASSMATTCPGQRSTVIEATIRFVAGSMRNTVPLSAPTTPLETQIESTPAAMPSGWAINGWVDGSSGMVALTRLVEGSMRETVPSPRLPTQTAP